MNGSLDGPVRRKAQGVLGLRRGTITLACGVSILTGLAVATLVTSSLDPRLGEAGVPTGQLGRVQPPYVPFLQRALSADRSCTHMIAAQAADNSGGGRRGGLMGRTAARRAPAVVRCQRAATVRSTSDVFERPDTVAVVRRLYEYRPIASDTSAIGLSVETTIDDTVRVDFLRVELRRGLISGIPPDVGAYDVVVFATMADSSQHTQRFKLVVSPFVSRPLVTAVARRQYRYMPVVDDTAQVRFTLEVAAGSAALGAPDSDSLGTVGEDPLHFLTVDAETGLVSGVPTVYGSYDVTLVATRDDSSQFRQSFPLVVTRGFHPLGTTQQAEDVVVQLVRGAGLTLIPGALAALFGVGFGLLLGAQSGFFGGRWERSVTLLSRGIEALPALLLIVLGALLFGRNLYAIMVVVGVTIVPEVARTIADRVAQFRKREFIEAARELGQRDRTILWTEIVWSNLRPLVVAQIARVFTLAIMIEVALSYLGLVDTEATTLGQLMLEGKDSLLRDSPQPWLMVFSGLVVVIAVAGFRMIESGVERRYTRRQHT